MAEQYFTVQQDRRVSENIQQKNQDDLTAVSKDLIINVTFMIYKYFMYAYTTLPLIDIWMASTFGYCEWCFC